MAIPEPELKAAEEALARFCEGVPPEVRDQLRNEWRVRGNQITLMERRAPFDDPDEIAELPIARLQYHPDSRTWTLRCFDSNGRSHVYEGFERVEQFEACLAEVQSDPTGIFLG